MCIRYDGSYAGVFRPLTYLSNPRWYYLNPNINEVFRYGVNITEYLGHAHKCFRLDLWYVTPRPFPSGFSNSAYILLSRAGTFGMQRRRRAVHACCCGASTHHMVVTHGATETTLSCGGHRCPVKAALLQTSPATSSCDRVPLQREPLYRNSGVTAAPYPWLCGTPDGSVTLLFCLRSAATGQYLQSCSEKSVGVTVRGAPEAFERKNALLCTCI